MKANVMQFLSGILLALVSGFLAVLVLLSCAAAEVGTNVDRQVDFSQFHTYGWATPDVQVGNNPLYDNDILRNNLQMTLGQELAKRGLRYQADNPDLLVGYHVYTEKKKEVVPDYGYPNGYYNGWGYYPYGYTNWPYQWNTGFRTVRYTEGTLIIDVIQAKDKMLIWRGWDSAEVDDPETAEADATRGVALILKKYPVKALASR
ncbi:MAG TPA: DUF4136 domain-containing protein [Cytophagales bacterium]